ncbi:hypothetical protein [Endozoicomonas sp. ONNA2]|uniref:hypothetical protein n=1 Tax=Endozoicomonas sp. ONNA2 TaxID=2828741 RepID=UPI0021489088|nr:hypothetical protein [Endozoicomonas sp. ONNA2]
MNYGISSTSATATAALQGMHNSVPESNKKTDVVPSIPPADHWEKGKSLTDRQAHAIFRALASNKKEGTEAERDADRGVAEMCAQAGKNDKLAEKVAEHCREIMRDKLGFCSVDDSEVTESDLALAKDWLSSVREDSRKAVAQTEDVSSSGKK